MLLAIALAAALKAGDSPAAPVHDGGVCAALSWVALAPGERVVKARGPDFYVLRFEGPKGPKERSWGVYAGRYAQVEGNGPVLLKKDGVTVRRAIEDGKFQGYLARRDGDRLLSKRDQLERGAGLENHFFGSIFDGTDADKAFFARIDFGARGQALCAKR